MWLTQRFIQFCGHKQAAVLEEVTEVMVLLLLQHTHNVNSGVLEGEKMFLQKPELLCKMAPPFRLQSYSWLRNQGF